MLNRMLKIHSRYANRKSRQAFSQAEDEALRRLVNMFGETNWTLISQKMPNRNPRQCRDRWRCYLRPTLVKSQWTDDEDRLLLQKYSEIGPKWSIIGKYLPGRSEITMKNRWKLLTKGSYKNQANPASNSMNINPQLNQGLNAMNAAININLNPTINIAPNITQNITPNISQPIQGSIPPLSPAISTNMSTSMNAAMSPSINPNLNSTINSSMSPVLSPTIPSMNQTLNGGNVYFVTTFQSQQPQQPPPQSPQQVQQLQNPQQVQSQPNQQTIQIQSQNQQQQQNSNQNQQIQQQQSPTSNQKGDSSQKVPPAHTIVRKAVHTRKNLIVEKKSQESSPDTSAADGELATTPSSMEKTNSQNLEAFFNSLTKSPGLRNPRNLM